MQSRKKFKTVILTGIILLVIIVGAVFAVNSHNDSNSTHGDDVSVFGLSKRNLTENINISGSVTGDAVAVSSFQSTRCITVNVAVGDFVTEGDVLFVFDTKPLEEEYEKLLQRFNTERSQGSAELSAYERNLTNARTEKGILLEQEQRRINSATKARDEAYDKHKQLVNKFNELDIKVATLQRNLNNAEPEAYAVAEFEYANAVGERDRTRLEMDELGKLLRIYDDEVAAAHSAYQNTERSADRHIQDAQNTINAAKYRIYTVSQSDIEAVKEKIDNLVVSSPVSGVVSQLNVIEGTMAASDVLVTIVETSNLTIKANVSEKNIHKLEVGMRTIIGTAATGDEEIEGKIAKISSIINPAFEGDDRSFLVEIEISERKKFNKVFLGMSAMAKIVLNETIDVFAVPYDSIVRHDDTDFIMAVEPTGSDYIVKKLPIEKGVESNYFIQISGEGLVDGLKIIYNPKEVHEDMVVSIKIEE